MQALVKTQRGAGNVELREMPEPGPGPGQVLIQVSVCGICGTDLHVFDDEFYTEPPVILGHEFSGRVAALGDGVDDLQIDQPIIAYPCTVCGHCFFCRSGRENLCPDRRAMGARHNGAFAPLAVLPREHVFPLPAHVSPEEASMAEPMACGVHGLVELGGLRSGDSVAVIGPGPIGCLTALVARLEGARVSLWGTAGDKARLKAASHLGLDHVGAADEENAVEAILDQTEGKGADVVCDCSGANTAIDLAGRMVRRGGRYVQIGLFGKRVSFDLDRLVIKEVSVHPSFASRPSSWRIVRRYFERDDLPLNSLISHTLPLIDWQEGFELARNKQGVKVLLTP